MDNNFFLNYIIQPQSNFQSSSDSFYNTNLEHSMDQLSHFESALSSMVSSPVSASNSAISNDGFQIRELIGKLGTVCNSGEIPATATYPGTSNTSCYTTPMNSPPNLKYPITDQFVSEKFPNLGNSIPNYPPIAADPGFAERAAKFSCFGSRSFNGRSGPNNSTELGYRSSPLMGNSMKLTRVSSTPSLKLIESQLGSEENNNLGKNQVEIGSNLVSPVATQVPESSSRKRKAISRAKSKETKVVQENVNLKSKRQKDNEQNESENGSHETEAEKKEKGYEREDVKANTKAPEPFKDYIHVRARRGQATDSHSLAERVRREKIGERMKLLQDLVPGCNKVTGKALMLDEIINYVQSLQRQVEFLSMKLATVNPMLDFNMDSLLSKDVIQPIGSMGNELDTSASHLFGHHIQKVTHQVHNNNNIFNVDPLHSIFRHNIGLQSTHPHDFPQGLTQFQTLCEDDLQSIVQMGFGHETPFHSQDFPGSSQGSHMKVEL